MTNRIQVYVFRAGDTWVTAAPVEAVVAIYGGGGLKQTAGLSAAFRGCAVYGRSLLFGRARYLGIWGERKASRFRQSFRNAGMEVEIVKSPPPGRLLLWLTMNKPRRRSRDARRPAAARRRGGLTLP